MLCRRVVATTLNCPECLVPAARRRDELMLSASISGKKSKTPAQNFISG
jgi:hypothetical protein